MTKPLPPSAVRKRAPKGSHPSVRLKMHSTVDPETGCWVWGGSKDGGGYGFATYNGRSIRVHCLSHIAFIGPIPDGLHVDHLCNNRLCCNPAHLEAVTQAENNRRRDARKTARGEAA